MRAEAIVRQPIARPDAFGLGRCPDQESVRCAYREQAHAALETRACRIAPFENTDRADPK
jgi:hypothetical protein